MGSCSLSLRRRPERGDPAYRPEFTAFSTVANALGVALFAAFAFWIYRAAVGRRNQTTRAGFLPPARSLRG